jgi:hypothetical protein
MMEAAGSSQTVVSLRLEGITSQKTIVFIKLLFKVYWDDELTLSIEQSNQEAVRHSAGYIPAHMVPGSP